MNYKVFFYSSVRTVLLDRASRSMVTNGKVFQQFPYSPVEHCCITTAEIAYKVKLDRVFILSCLFGKAVQKDAFHTFTPTNAKL